MANNKYVDYKNCLYYRTINKWNKKGDFCAHYADYGEEQPGPCNFAPKGVSAVGATECGLFECKIKSNNFR